MNKLPQALIELMGDPDGKRAEDCLLAVVAELERAGIKERAIAKALSRVLLGFCVDKGRHAAHFGWVDDMLEGAGKRLQAKAFSMRRRWVRKFMARTARLYRDARFEVHVEPPAIKQALDARLGSLDTQGQA